jgi:murein DD-endopeptidase MepM/ murein hydrolase activator NlpD
MMVFCAGYAGAPHAGAMDWPLEETTAVFRNFGYNDRGKPVPGMVFTGEGQVFTAGDGEIIFSRGERDWASRLPSPLGAWTAVDHNDGLISIYARYSDEGTAPQLRYAEKGSAIARAGISGWSRRDGLYFMLYDRRDRRWVNPAMVITPVEAPEVTEIAPPQILGIQLRAANGKIYEGSQLRTLSQGKYSIIINARGGLYPAPHRIACFVNGSETGSLVFETICAADGMIMVNRNGLTPALRVYAPFPAYEAGEVQLNRGQALLEVIVSDITDISRSVVTRILVE